MAVSEAELRTEGLGQTLLDVFFHLDLLTSRGRRRNGDLKDLELLTLSILSRRDRLIVGDIQRQLGILPAQMSRIIRSLESRSRPLISCRINARDKRKIDVTLTPAGLRAFRELRTERSDRLTELLQHLSEDDQDDLQRLMEKLRLLVGDALRSSEPSPE